MGATRGVREWGCMQSEGGIFNLANGDQQLYMQSRYPRHQRSDATKPSTTSEGEEAAIGCSIEEQVWNGISSSMLVVHNSWVVGCGTRSTEWRPKLSQSVHQGSQEVIGAGAAHRLTAASHLLTPSGVLVSSSGRVLRDSIDMKS